MATKTAKKENIVSIKPDVSTQLDALRKDVGLLTEALKLQTKQTVSETTETVRDVAADKTEMARAKYDELTTKAEASIKENPLTSIALAVGAGLILGALTRR